MPLGLLSPLLFEEVFKVLSQNRILSGCSAVEQIMDIPVPGRGGGGARGRLSTTAADVEQIVDIPARRGLQGFPPRQSPTAVDVEQIVDIPAREVFQIFSKAKVQHRVDCMITQMRELKGVFRTFPRSKKSPKVTRQSGEAPDEALADIVLKPNMWRDEAGYVWMHFSSKPSQWYLLQNSAVYGDELGVTWWLVIMQRQFL